MLRPLALRLTLFELLDAGFNIDDSFLDFPSRVLADHAHAEYDHRHDRPESEQRDHNDLECSDAGRRTDNKRNDCDASNGNES